MRAILLHVPSSPFFRSALPLLPPAPSSPPPVSLSPFLSLSASGRFFGPTTPVPLYESRDPREKRARRRCYCVRVCRCAYVRIRVRASSYVTGAGVCACARARTRASPRLCVGERARACVRGGARVSVSHLTTT